MLSSGKIPVSVVVVTRNAAAVLEPCLTALSRFDEVIVVDSQSTDKTQEIALKTGVRVVDFIWDGRYPKKRQWCLQHLELAHDWVFFADADEVVTDALVDEIAALDLAQDRAHAGYFVSGRYVWHGTMLRFGLRNRKIALLHKGRMCFPVVDDLDLPGMGEIEGHYQPVLRDGVAFRIGSLGSFLLHDAYDDAADWAARHHRYAAWEVAMDRRKAWPQDPVVWRRWMKAVFKALPRRDIAAFLHSYVLKLGVLDGRAGFEFACSRAQYYAMISALSKTNRAQGWHGEA